MANALHAALRTPTGLRHGLRVLDIFLAAKDFWNGGPAFSWWHFTPISKATLQGLVNPTHLLCESLA